MVHINLTLQKTTKFVVSSGIRTRIIGFPEPSSGTRTRIFACLELSSQLGLIASLIQLKCTKYFRDDLMLVFEDAQCFNSISKIIVRDMKNSRFILICLSASSNPARDNELSLFSVVNVLNLVFHISEDGS